MGVIILKIKVQKVLRFIPFINLLNFFFLIKTCAKYNVGALSIIKFLGMIFLALIIVTIPEILVDKMCNTVAIVNLVGFLSTLLEFFVISFLSVKIQENIISKADIEN